MSAASANAFAGVPDLSKLITRRERISLPIWCYAIIASVAGTAYSFKKLYTTPQSLAQFADTIYKSPALNVLYGKPFDLTTIGGITAWRIVGFGGVILAIMSIITVNRHTRAEEESGRFELVGAGAVGRHAPLIAVLRVVLGTQLALALILGFVLMLLGQPAQGSFLLGLSIAVVGWVFAGVTAITVQLTDFGRAAGGLAFTVLGAAFLIRAVGDGSGSNGPAWLTWLSPIGWAEEAQAYAANRWWVLLIGVAATVVLIAAAFRIAGRRDLGSGIFPAKPGPARGSDLLRSVSALSWRMQRGNLIGWGTGALIFGAVLGGIASSISELIGTSAQFQQIIQRMGGQAGLVDSYLATVMNLMGLILACYAIQTTVRMRTEETNGCLEPLLATKTSRLRWAAGHLVYPVVGTALLLAVTGFGVGVTNGGRIGDVGNQLAELVWAGMIQLPAVWLVVGICVAVYGFAPQAVSWVGWTVIGICILLQELGPILKFSHWISDISPFSQVPRAPGVAIPAEPLIIMTAIAVVLFAAGLAGFRRRDIG